MGLRILVTGVANPFGVRLAAELAGRSDVDRVIGLDTRTPPDDVHDAITFVRADLRSPDLLPLLRAAGVDRIVHNDVVQFAEPGRSLRQAHDVNVIGTLQLLAAATALPGLDAIVLRGSATIYGSEPDAPAFWTEDLVRDGTGSVLRTRWQRDCAELEGLLGTFARRHRDVTCTLLRLQPVVSRELDTPVARLLRAPVIPTYLGYDPRMQVVDMDDAVDAVAAAALRPVRGAVNVAGEGVVSLQRVLRRLGRPSVPIAAPLFGTVSGLMARTVGLPAIPPDAERFLRYGRGVDLRRMREELRFTPRWTTLEAIERAAGHASTEVLAA